MKKGILPIGATLPSPRRGFFLPCSGHKRSAWGEEMKALPGHTRPLLRTQSTNHKGVKRASLEDTADGAAVQTASPGAISSSGTSTGLRAPWLTTSQFPSSWRPVDLGLPGHAPGPATHLLTWALQITPIKKPAHQTWAGRRVVGTLPGAAC